MNPTRRLALAALAALLVAPVSLALARQAPTPQAHVHSRAHEVMPFRISAVMHVFRMTETGGVMQVVLRDPDDTSELAAIRRHLRHEASRFAAGDFADPSHLHGPSMPGLAELGRGAARLRVHYAEREDGAEIRFEADDIALVTAVHRWFGAQLSEHGADARAE